MENEQKSNGVETHEAHKTLEAGSVNEQTIGISFQRLQDL